MKGSHAIWHLPFGTPSAHVLLHFLSNPRPDLVHREACLVLDSVGALKISRFSVSSKFTFPTAQVAKFSEQFICIARGCRTLQWSGLLSPIAYRLLLFFPWLQDAILICFFCRFDIDFLFITPWICRSVCWFLFARFRLYEALFGFKIRDLRIRVVSLEFGMDLYLLLLHSRFASILLNLW